MKTILLPGGLGYIGSHTVIALLPFIEHLPLRILIIDNLSNSSPSILQSLLQISSTFGYSAQLFNQKVQLVVGDILDKAFLEQTFAKLSSESPVETVIHFAAKKSVLQSTEDPLSYFQTNVVGSLHLLQMVERFNVPHFIFSSSASVYGRGGKCTEQSALGALSPYGDSKHIVEIMMKGLGQRYPEKSILALRYFNPVGAHHSGLIGDEPLAPNNLFPVIEQVVTGKRQVLEIYGSDYDTVDGSGIRDYIHIEDLAEGHAFAFRKIQNLRGYNVINLGTGEGVTVKQIVDMYERVNGIKIKQRVVGRRAGDIACLIALVGKAEEVLGWKAKRTMEVACQDSYRFVTRPR